LATLRVQVGNPANCCKQGMQDHYSDEQLRLAARLYYIDGLPQAEVASLVKVSQAKVSRLLAAARERGIVRISVAEYSPRNEELEKQLIKRFKLKAVGVIKVVNDLPLEDVRRTVAHFGAPFVTSLLPANGTVAISGGRTMRDLVSQVPENRKLQLTLVQAMGSMDSNVGTVDAQELGRIMASRLGGFLVTLNTPAFVPDKRMRDSFLRLEQIRSVWARLNAADVALVGIGTPGNSIFVERGVLNAADLKKLLQAGAVGEICGRFFDVNGKECDSPWRDRVLSISLEQLCKIPQVVGVVSGADRAAAIAAAVRGGVLKSLIIDEPSATALLQLTKGSK
jgi:deoxyribonucleoside regulator